ncbi:MAG: outer membrane protein assembly factor [Sinobacteraceae bacterium]|nr:outer membrane protein assembly factor [Nevskiaceae bacterium]MCP5360333.1 outer membrane protein assembly factor [Nevskiaceae bacterium]MCP5471166.1 outer membrane protein assembly factor [Nevskiaceae bacterium]
MRIPRPSTAAPYLHRQQPARRLALGLALVLAFVPARTGATEPPAPRRDAAPAAIEATIEITGIDAELAAAARASLELQQFTGRTVTTAQLRRLVARGEQQIRRGLEPYGYYEATVAGTATGGGERWQARFAVTPGPRVVVERSRIEVAGPAAEFAPVREALATFQPRIGEPLDHAQYEASKARIAATLQSSGFFDASLERHRVEVTRAARSAAIDLAWDGGQRYRIGAVNFSQAQFPEQMLQRYVPWEADAWYSVDELLKLQQRLIDADYFSIVSVQPNLAGRQDGQVPVDVLLAPAKRTIYRAAAYVSTDSGPGGKLGIDRRWVNDRGHKWSAEIEYSSRLQAASSRYRIPRPGQHNRYYDFVAGYHDEVTDTTHSRLSRLSASEVLDLWHGYGRTLGLQYLDGDFTVADERRSSQLLFAEALLERKRADNLLFPQRGLAVSYGLRLASPALLSDTSLAQLRADARWVRPAGEASRLILRASLGVLTTGNFDALPPELRFFAGGDRSVRGFDYQAIGERNETGGVIGGRRLAVASVEYEHYFLERWGAAVFVDAGDAFSSGFSANVGAGVGVRWKSPVGLVRLDLAVPVRTALDDDGLRFHVIIGPDL